MIEFAARYTDEDGPQQVPSNTWGIALLQARTLRSDFPDASVVSREDGGEWQHVWPQPTSWLADRPA